MSNSTDEPDQPSPPLPSAPEHPEEESELPNLPVWQPEDIPLDDDVFMMVPQAEIAERFGPVTAEFTKRVGGRGFTIRASNDSMRAGMVDALELSALLAAVGKVTRWFNQSLFDQSVAPGVESALAVRSVIINFRAGEDEDSFMMGDSEITPTAYSGAYVAHLMAVGDNPETVLERIGPLGKNAVKTLRTTMHTLAHHELDVDWLVTPAARPRAYSSTPGRALDLARVLDRPGGTRHRTETVDGYLFAANQEAREFRLRGDDGREIKGTYPVAADQSLEDAWRKRVRARLRVTEATEPSLPRAPKTEYTLMRVTQIYGPPSDL